MIRSSSGNALFRAALLLCTGATVLPAQSRKTVDVSPNSSCEGCRIELVRVATLGSDKDSLSATWLAHSVSRDGRGRYYLAPTADFSLIAVYDANGNFLRTLGRRGVGPGEYDFIVSASVQGDSLLVLDQGSRRLTRLTPDYTVARTIPAAGTFASALALPGGSFLVTGTVRTPEWVGQPLFVLDSSGKILRAFGGDGEAVHYDRPQAQTRRIALTPSADVWAGRVDRYELELWRMDGTPLQVLRRAVAWYPPWTDYNVQAPDVARPKPMLTSIKHDSAGLVWTMTRVAVENWKPSAKPSPEGKERPVPSVNVYDQNSDVILEVIDPRTGALIVSQRFPQYLQAFINGGLLYSLRETEEGDIRVDVWRATLNGHK